MKKKSKEKLDQQVNTEINIPPRPESISVEQWSLPASFKPDGTFATLKEVVDTEVDTSSLEAITTSARKDLVIERLRQQPNYPTKYMLGAGIVDRERAIAEVEAGTDVGNLIQETEQRVIQYLQEIAKTGSE